MLKWIKILTNHLRYLLCQKLSRLTRPAGTRPRHKTETRVDGSDPPILETHPMSLTMNQTAAKLTEVYVETLLNGDRQFCRQIIEQALANGFEAYQLLNELVWPTMETIQELYKDDRINIAQLNMATRLNR